MDVGGVEVVTDDPVMRARKLVQYQYNVQGIGTPRGQKIDRLELDEVMVVWFNYTLGNWKCILTTARDDDRIYEVTYKREASQMFIDTYLKTHNLAHNIKE